MSLSVIVTDNVFPKFMLLYLTSADAGLAITILVSLLLLLLSISSSVQVTVTVCSELQLAIVNVRERGKTVATVVSPLVIPIVTSAVG